LFVRQGRIFCYAMIIIETPIFTKLIQTMMSDDEYKEIQVALVKRLNLGDITKSSGELRKVRWNIEGRGKRS